MKLILIPPGSFTMGSPANEVDRDKEETQVGVTLTEPYWLGKREVSQSEWQRVVHTTPWIDKEQTQVGDNFPANYLDWQQAMSFCQELTAADRRAGRLPSGFEYTLPTEAQWEYACRAGTTTRFSFGDDDSRLVDYAWFDQNSFSIGEEYPHEVAKKKPNPWGLYDMHGNSWEWCRDWFADRLPGGTDPEVSTGVMNRVMRGGCVSRTAKDCRSASRGFDTPSNQFARLGLRVALCMASHDVAKTDDGARRDATQRTALAIRTQSGPALPIAPFEESAAKKAPPEEADRLKTPVAPSQPKAQTDGTKDSRPWYTVRVQVLQCCDDNGGRECAISIKEIRKMLDLANKIYAKARLRFVWSPAKDSAVLRNTLINSLMPGGSFSPKDRRATGAGTVEQGHSECRKIAERYPGKMVVFFRWGDHIHNPAGSGYSGGNNSWVVMPSPRATNMGPRGFSHEVGHYFGLDHTFARGFSSVAEASEFLKNHGDDMSVFDGDRLSDTLPDPGLNIAFNNGVRKVTLNGKDVPIPTGNLMSYMNWDGHEWMSNQQAERVRAFCRFRSRFGMVYPTNIGAPNPIEAESLPFETRGDFSAAAQRMAGFGFGWWSGDAQVWANGRLGGSLVLKFEVKEPGPKNVNVYMTFAPDNGKADISIDGKRVGQTFDGFAPLLSASGPISLGRVDLSQGAHTIEFTLVGKNEESKGTGLGVDCVSLVAVKP